MRGGLEANFELSGGRQAPSNKRQGHAAEIFRNFQMRHAGACVGDVHNRTTAGSTATRSRLMRSNAPSKGHPVRTASARHPRAQFNVET